MGWPSLTTVLSVLFLAYMANSLWSLGQLYFPPDCKEDCITNSLTDANGKLGSNGGIRLLLLTSVKDQPRVEADFTYLDTVDVWNPAKDLEQTLKVKLPTSVSKKNGTLYLAVFSMPLIKQTSPDPKHMHRKWMAAIRSPDVTYSLVPLTVHHVPEPETFNLLGGGDKKREEGDAGTKATPPKPSHAHPDVPVVHVRSKIFVRVMTDQVAMARREIPGEIYPLVRLKEGEKAADKYLPLVWVDSLSQRLKDLVKVNGTEDKEVAEVEVTYTPISWGKLRIFLAFSASLSSMKNLGFTDKDTDEVKGIFADTNMALLALTFTVSAVHLLFDFLAFKNDISFWSGRTDMTGLSTRTLIWRAVSQTVITLYLLEENTSLLVLIPSACSVVIECWKVSKAFTFSLAKGFHRKFDLDNKATADDKVKKDSGDLEKLTEEIDGEAMTYLSYVLYPLLAGGAVYSLLYTPHKSWYSWTIQSLVNAVYAFGFLFMLPQLFVNYKLKSVAHLPWRAFTYKAFNTFIDDLFAFIITMPTAHRVACFRDDVVFVVYLYQRYLYPVDKNRVDASGMIEETPPDQTTKGKAKAE